MNIGRFIRQHLADASRETGQRLAKRAQRRERIAAIRAWVFTRATLLQTCAQIGISYLRRNLFTAIIALAFIAQTISLHHAHQSADHAKALAIKTMALNEELAAAYTALLTPRDQEIVHVRLTAPRNKIEAQLAAAVASLPPSRLNPMGAAK